MWLDPTRACRTDRKGASASPGYREGPEKSVFRCAASYIGRLGVAPNELFYSDVPAAEKEVQHFMGKFLACTEDERKILLKTLDCLAEQFISRHYKTSETQDSK